MLDDTLEASECLGKVNFLLRDQVHALPLERKARCWLLVEHDHNVASDLANCLVCHPVEGKALAIHHTLFNYNLNRLLLSDETVTTARLASVFRFDGLAGPLAPWAPSLHLLNKAWAKLPELNHNAVAVAFPAS